MSFRPLILFLVCFPITLYGQGSNNFSGRFLRTKIERYTTPPILDSGVGSLSKESVCGDSFPLERISQPCRPSPVPLDDLSSHSVLSDPTSTTLVVVQEGSNLRVTVLEDGNRTTMNYNLNGKSLNRQDNGFYYEDRITLRRKSLKIKSSFSSSANDIKKLSRDKLWVVKLENHKEEWSLSPDSRTLRIWRRYARADGAEIEFYTRNKL
jgi:hypothetical protein